jgi:viologen exporter family transport system ATP-binding protein
VHKSFTVPLKGQMGLKSMFYRKNKTIEALNDINFTVDEGEFVGYIGPNGAGKSTTIKLLTGILYPTEGSLHVLGFDPNKDRYKYTYNIGVVFGQRSLLEYDIPVINSFTLYKSIYELDQKQFIKRLGEFTEILELKELLHIPVRKLSLGQRMRCEIAASLLHNPKVVFLDEPTIGLDALAKEEIRNFLKRINETEKVTVLLTTHDMGDIEHLCERIIFINKGRIIYDGPLTTLKKKYASNKDVKIVFEGPVTVPDQFKPMLKESYDNTLTFSVDYAEAVNIVPSLLQLGRARDLSIHEQRLEDVVKIIYKSAGKDG